VIPEMNLPNLPKGWAWTTLGEIRHDRRASINPIKTPKKLFELYSVPSFEKKKPEIIEGAKIGSNKQAVDKETVLLCKINPRINRVWIVGDFSKWQKIASTEWIPFFNVSSISPKYLCYFLMNNDFRSFLSLNVSGVGGSLMRVKPSTLVKYPFPLAPTQEQHRIVTKIEELFSDLKAGVAALGQAREKLKLYRAALLKAAVEGALTEEWRQQHTNTEPASKLLKRILVERHSRWEAEQLRIFKEKGKNPPQNWKTKYKEPDAPDTTNLPPLPEGWCWGSWGQIGVSQNGRPFPSKEYVDSGIKLLRPGNLYADGSVGWNDKNTRFMPEQYARNSSDLIIRGEELVINLTAQSLKDEFLGRVCLTKSGERCLLNQRLARLTPILVPSKYMLYVLKSWHFRKFVDELNTGSLIQHMFTSQLERYVLPLPPLLEQEVIVEAVEDQLSMIDHLEAELDTMLRRAQALRQAILKKAFTGRLVSQDPEDEPATMLLERIRKEKAKQAAGKKPGRAAPKKTAKLW
jgi:type I restriction enzyme S subunit